MDIVGVDGCKTGWFFIRLGDGEPRWGVSSTAADLLAQHRTADLILIDIPVGLRDAGVDERFCDKEARKVLGRRGSSVFPAPSRLALSASSYLEASSLNRTLTGRSLSKQSWAISPKILEVDLLMRFSAEARFKIREVHPEVCFTALNAGQPMQHNKKKPEGAAERSALLAGLYAPATDILAGIGHPLPRGVARDDVLDALCAAVTGVLGVPLLTLPSSPERDGHDLPMEMVYADLSSRPGL